ncbi:IPT/TIG domain-containing protein [Nocardia wallacei]|uniref:IPT/TIG domain-containing protein n=1 Tax=Nocardia wallacei TaxID=480035 RepID=UPI002456324E|nr:IPT/TIG domain-containing protein [Nocardia wallacei]
MAGNSVANIGVGAPLASGGVMVAATGTTLPVGVTAATTDFTKLGLVADDGLRPSGERASTDIFDWAGDLIYSPQDTHSTQFQFKLYAAFDGDVLAEVFGEDNVTTVGSLTTVEETGEPLGIHPWLFDMRDKAKRVRIVVPAGQITAVAEDPFVRNALQAFDVTLTCYKDDNGKKAYRYYDNGSAPSVPTISVVEPAGTLATAGGDILYLTGTNFTGTSAATVGATAVLDYLVVDDQHLIITTPAKTAGTQNLVVTNATGPSATFALTYA